MTFPKEHPLIMSILTLLIALLLSSSTNFTVHTNSVVGGGPTSGIQAAGTTSTPPAPDSVSGGGPIL
jgi:hypothetical protein